MLLFRCPAFKQSDQPSYSKQVIYSCKITENSYNNRLLMRFYCHRFLLMICLHRYILLLLQP